MDFGTTMVRMGQSLALRLWLRHDCHVGRAWDTRRYLYIDNNPAGHNTVVIREAFGDESGAGGDPNGNGGSCTGNTSDINFSQMNQEVGSISMANVTRDDDDAQAKAQRQKRQRAER